MSLDKKSILVTGGSKRIGKYLALAAAAEGADVVLHYRKSEKEAARLADQIRAMGRRVGLIQADLNDPQEVSSIIPRALEHGPLFAIVNNASIFEQADWHTTSLDSWNRHIMTNLTAPFLLS